MEQQWNRLLGGIPRETPPDIAIETLLERSEASRRPLLLAAAVLLAAGSLLSLRAGSTESGPPPVHLRIEVVQEFQGMRVDDAESSAVQPVEEFERP